MKIVRIFADFLLSFHYEDEELSEYERLLDLWTDMSFLDRFHNENSDFIDEERDDFIDKITRNAERFDDLLAECDSDGIANLKARFEPLDDMAACQCSVMKSKGKLSVLRLYALKIGENCYVITGGAIKVTEKMEQHPTTNKELQKLDHCRNYLIDENVFDRESLVDFIKEEEL